MHSLVYIGKVYNKAAKSNGKHSSLLQKFFINGQKRFYNIDPIAYKTHQWTMPTLAFLGWWGKKKFCCSVQVAKVSVPLRLGVACVFAINNAPNCASVNASLSRDKI